MRRTPLSDVLKILVYVAAVVVLGAALAPVCYNLGKGLAEITEDKQTNAVVNWLAKEARQAELPAFFKLSISLCGLVLMIPLAAVLRLNKTAADSAPWRAPMPANAVGGHGGQPLQRNGHGPGHLLTGFVLAAGLMLLSGWLMIQAGCFVWKDAAVSTRGAPNPGLLPGQTPAAIPWQGLLSRALITALLVAWVQETLFRGVLLGIFLRAMKPANAILAIALLFAFFHHLSPTAVAAGLDPERSDAGFQLLGRTLRSYADPQVLFSQLAVAVALGIVLGAARHRTASLWLPIGLHAGWRFAVLTFSAAAVPLPLPEPVRWLIGGSLMTGTVPLAVVATTGFLMYAMTRPEDHEIV